MDGGVLANNPCNQGLAKIQKFHHDLHKKLPIALVVSVGTGIYPPDTLGRVDAQEFLFFGRHWLDFTEHVKARAGNLISLLSNAVRGIWGVGIRCREEEGGNMHSIWACMVCYKLVAAPSPRSLSLSFALRCMITVQDVG